MTTYTLRVTYVEPDRRVKVQNVRGLDWVDAVALENALAHEPTTCRVDIKAEIPAWAR